MKKKNSQRSEDKSWHSFASKKIGGRELTSVIRVTHIAYFHCYHECKLERSDSDYLRASCVMQQMLGVVHAKTQKEVHEQADCRQIVDMSNGRQPTRELTSALRVTHIAYFHCYHECKLERSDSDFLRASCVRSQVGARQDSTRRHWQDTRQDEAPPGKS